MRKQVKHKSLRVVVRNKNKKERIPSYYLGGLKMLREHDKENDTRVFFTKKFSRKESDSKKKLSEKK